ncbi:lysine--tRNA ligase [Candidatus Woesearchaeota archaeon]|nr:lysine--tRNA ligase [Candidatus Woesearchaeota archaeon]
MPGQSEEEIMAHRRALIQQIRASGTNPYPYRFALTHTTADVRAAYDERVNPRISLDDRVLVAGRVMVIRRKGRQTFMDMYDQGGKLQISVRSDRVGNDDYTRIRQQIDRGDIVGIEGKVMRTRTGELTVDADQVTLLTKSLRPLPTPEYTTAAGERKGGLVDPELMYRQPALRLIMHPGARDILLKRAKAISSMREILERHGYTEVEIPTLQPVYGGAAARPFVTTINAYRGMELFLSISPELYLKQLVVGGLFNGVYTICKNFRNEGVDRTHNPEFTMMECYKAFWDYDDLMKLTENMWAEIFDRVNGSPTVRYAMPHHPLGKQTLDFTPPWKRERFTDLIAERTGLDVEKMDAEELRQRARKPYKSGKPYLQLDDQDTKSWGDMVQLLFEAYVEDTIIQPTHVIDHPRESTPLCKGHRQDPRLIERFEPFVYGVEIGNAYSELNDPLLQRELLEAQVRQFRSGDQTVPNRVDEPFCRAIEYGMPPTAGLGIGIDRLVMFLTGSDSIREVIAFPFMRPEGSP